MEKTTMKMNISSNIIGSIVLPNTNEFVPNPTLNHAVLNLANSAPFSIIEPQQPITLIFPNSIEYVTTFLATLSVRAIAAPLNPNLAEKEIEWFIKNLSSKCVIIPGKHQEIDDPLVNGVWKKVIPLAKKLGLPVYSVLWVCKELKIVRVDGDKPVDSPIVNHIIQREYSSKDIALMLHTSGTTSTPKAVPLTHKNILTTVGNIKQTYLLTSSDITYLVMPLFHVHGLIGALLSTLCSGGTVVLPPKFSVTCFWKDVLHHDCTWYSAVPTIHQMLLLKAKEFYPGNSGRLRFIRSCSASLAPATLSQLESTFKVPVIEAYAMTEASHQMSSNYLPPGIRKPGSVGQGRGVRIKIFSETGQFLTSPSMGEICIQGNNVIKNYYKNPKADETAFYPTPVGNKSTKWFRTGDLGYFDHDEFLFITGRIKEQINRGGEKISPVEIDNILLKFPPVAEAITFGVTESLYGQVVECVVVLKKEHQGKVGEKDVINWCKQHSATFKVPRKVHFVESIPKSATGKVQRRILEGLFYPEKKEIKSKL